MIQFAIYQQIIIKLFASHTVQNIMTENKKLQHWEPKNHELPVK